MFVIFEGIRDCEEVEGAGAAWKFGCGRLV